MRAIAICSLLFAAAACNKVEPRRYVVQGSQPEVAAEMHATMGQTYLGSRCLAACSIALSWLASATDSLGCGFDSRQPPSRISGASSKTRGSEGV